MSLLDKRDDFLDRHAEFGGGLLGALAGKDALGAGLHCRIGRAEKLVRVDDDVDADLREFVFGNLRVGRGDDDNRLVGGNLGAEALHEGDDFIRGLRLRVNHDAVRTRFAVCLATRDGVVLALTGDERLTTRDDHEVFRNLRLLADLDFVALIFDRRLLLDIAGLKE